MQQFNNIKIIAFDVGDTLLQVSHPKLLINCYKAEIAILRKSGLQFKDEDYYLATEKAWRESQKEKYSTDFLIVPKLIIKYLGYKANDKLLEEMNNSFVNLANKYKLKEKKINPGALNLIKYLHNKGYLLGIISDTNTSWARTWLKELKIDDYFQIIILSNEIGRKKASQKPFMIFKKLAKEKYKIKPNQIIMIGDLSVDMDAKKHGFKTILLDPIAKNTKHFIYQPDIKIKTLKDIKKYL